MAGMAPIVVLVCFIGVYSVNASMFDIGVLCAAGALGYWLRKFGYDVAPALLALVLGVLVVKIVTVIKAERLRQAVD